LNKGEYNLVVVAERGSLSRFRHHEELPKNRTLRFGKGGDFSMEVAEYGSNDYSSVISGPAKVSYRADFYPILKQTGMIGEEYIKQLNGFLNEETKEELKEQSQADKINTNLTDTLEVDVFEKDYLIDAYYNDFYIAHQLRVTVAFDGRIERFIAAKNKQITLQLILDISSLVFDVALNLAIPDFREMSWEKIHDIRQSPAGQSFREMLYRIQASVTQELTNIQSFQDAKEIVQKNFNKELFDEMSQFMPASGTTTLGIMCSLASLVIPAAGFVGNLNDVKI
jgi:hypothetical protein